jgi:hypothetical protein
MKRAACTIISPNYLAYARTLADSYLAAHPDHRFFALIVADLDDPAPFRNLGFEPVMLPQIGLADIHAEGMKYDILELNTNVKPTFLKFLLHTYALDQLVYLDPDILVLAPLDPVFSALDSGVALVLTPHITAPVFDGKQPAEQDHLYNGTYNLGFAAFAHNDEAWRILSWWERRCLDLGFSEGRTGLFVDQKWMNLAPGLFEHVTILRDAGCNMAYWNLHERKLRRAGETYSVDNPNSAPVPLRFFHFSGIHVDDPASLSGNTDRFTLAERPDLQPLFLDYKGHVLARRGAPAEKLPYGFATFSDGTVVTRLARRLYAKHREHFSGNPFDAKGAFANFARKFKLVAGPEPPPKNTWKQFNPRDRRVEMVHRVLKTALRVLGPHRYELLMRYLAHIAVLRNQSAFLREPDWPAE